MKDRKVSRYSRGRWQVERERSRIVDLEPPAVDGQAAPLSVTVPQLMAQFGLADRLWERALLDEWPTLVGAQVAKHTRPGRLHRKELVVFVANSVWLNEISRYGQKPLLANLQKRFGAGKIQSVRLQLDPG